MPCATVQHKMHGLGGRTRHLHKVLAVPCVQMYFGINTTCHQGSRCSQSLQDVQNRCIAVQPCHAASDMPTCHLMPDMSMVFAFLLPAPPVAVACAYQHVSHGHVNLVSFQLANVYFIHQHNGQRLVQGMASVDFESCFMFVSPPSKQTLGLGQS